jgi:hypothetical protein
VGIVRHAQASGARAIYRWQVHLDGAERDFRDCTREDVAALVAGYTERALGFADEAQRLKAVLQAMARENAARVGDLPMLDRGHLRFEAQLRPAPVDLDGGHRRDAAHSLDAAVDLAGATAAARPIEPAPPPTFDGGQSGHGAHTANAVAGEGHGSCETHGVGALAETSSGARMVAIPKTDPPPSVGEAQYRPEAHGSTGLADALLLIYADAVDDLERVRIATTNRIGALRRVKGMEGTPEERRLVALAESLQALEHSAVLELQRAMRAHPLGGWVKATVGVGEKQAGRLLAAIGDPADRPNVAKLWAYCGFHVRDGRAPKRERGTQANWNGVARMRARLVAESCIKARRSPYRPVYDAAREQYADRDTTDLHKHNMALRRVAKAMLRDLWIEARRLAA